MSTSRACSRSCHCRLHWALVPRLNVEVWRDPCRGVRGTGELCRERGLWDTGRPPRVSSLARARGALPGRSTPSSASRGIIEKKTEISSERADAQNSRGPLSEATQGSERTKNELSKGGPQSVGTPGSVADKSTVAEGDSSKLATGGTSAATPGSGETDTTKNGSEGAVGGEGDGSNLAKKRKPEEDSQKPGMNNGDSKKLKTEGEASVQQNSSNGDADVIEEVNENGTGGQGQETDGKEKIFAPLRLAVVPECYPEEKMTERQAEELETALIEKITPTQQGEPIQFSEAQYENGGLVFTCVNKATKSWLHSSVHKLVPWQGLKLAVRHADTTLKGSKFILWIVREMYKKSNQKILNWFQKQNKDISTAEWKIIRRLAETDKKERITIWVDDKSVEDLKAHNFILFLGLAKVRFLPMSEWMQQQQSVSTKVRDSQPAPQNAKRLPPNTLKKPLVPKLASKRFPPPRPLLGGPGPRAMPNPWKPGFAFPNSGPQVSRFDNQVQLRRELDFADAEPPRFRDTQFTALDRLSPRERRYASEQPRDRGFGYTADRSQGDRFFGSERGQLRDTRYGDRDPPQLRETRFTFSDRDSRYVTPNRDLPDNLRFRGSDAQLSRDSRFRDLDDLSFRESRFRSSDQLQSREGRFVDRDSLFSRDSGSRMSDSQLFRDLDSRMPRSQEGRFSGSDIVPQQLRSSYQSSTFSHLSRSSDSGRGNW